MSQTSAPSLQEKASEVSRVASLRPTQGLFAAATSPRRVSEDVFEVDIDDGWRVVRGPHGGYLASLLLRAMIERLSDPSRRPRVLSLHYPKVPKPGPAQLRTGVTRSGRSMSWLSAELLQDGEPCVMARAAMSTDWPSVEFNQHQPPVVPPPEEGLALVHGMPAFSRHFHYRSLFATPLGAPEGSDAVGGHIRLREPEPYDAPLLATLADAWFPATYAFDRRPVMGATLDLTVHFRDHAALSALDPEDYLLTIFRSRLATEGFFEEDGELWSPDGRLIAQSRQLAIATPPQRRP